MNAELLLKIAVALFFGSAFGLFIYYALQYIDIDVDEVWTRIKNFLKNAVNGVRDSATNAAEYINNVKEERKQRIPGYRPNQVIALRKQHKGFTGVYIIYNYTKNLYYVGQGQNVYVRCSNHFLGKGNPDIYADYKYGDEFFIEFVSLVESGYDNLDDLERYYIDEYNAVRRGYNKKRGNR